MDAQHQIGFVGGSWVRARFGDGLVHRSASKHSRNARSTRRQYPNAKASLNDDTTHNHGPSDFQTRVRRFVAAAACGAVLISPQVAFGLSEPQKLVAEAWRVVDQAYVDRTYNGHDWFKERQKAVKRAYADTDEGYEAIRMLLSLLNDPYTRFLTPAQHDAVRATATGELAGGVGLVFAPAADSDGYTHIAVAPDSDTPAGSSGAFHAGGVLTAVDGEDIQGLSPDDVAARVRGTPGTSVTLTVDGRAVTMKREALKLRSVVSELHDSVGLIRVRGFNERTADDIGSAASALRTKGARALVLDLRGNPGGYFSGGVDAARLFLHEGTRIVNVVNRNGVVENIDALADGALMDTPLALVVDGNTASASEILAGALHDNGRAMLVGERTYGKGVVQTVTPLSDGAAVAVTIAKYITPSGADINKKGIVPDVVAKCGAEDAIVCVPKNVLGRG